MVECGGGLRLALEATERLRVARHLVRQKLQRHHAVQAGVLSLEDNAHTAAAQLFQDAVVGDSLTNHGAALC